MSKNVLQIYLAFVLYQIFQVQYCISEGDGTTEPEPFPDILPREKCIAMLCSCDDIQKLGGVLCSTQLIFYPYLHDGLELEFTDFKYIPPRTFLGLRIKSLYLTDPELTLDENVLEGTTELTEFYVTQSSIQVIPDFRIVKESIKRIHILSSRLTSLEGVNLQNLTLLSELHFRNNSIRYIDPDVFKFTENVEDLDISHNLLIFIPPNLLDSMRGLYRFDASFNNLLHLDNIFTSVIPVEIDLRYNNITNADSIVQLNMEKIMEYSNDYDILSNDYDYNITDEFNQTFLVFTLDLSYNLIKDISRIFIPCYQNWTGATYGLRINRLILSGNDLQSLNASLRYSRVFKMEAVRNKIQYLSNEDFTFAFSIQKLELQENKIRWIDTDNFKAYGNELEHLDMSFNLITSLNGSLRYLGKLKSLNIAHNFIQFFSKDEFTGLFALSELKLEYNRIKVLGQLQVMPYLQSLNIIGNDIKLITPDQVPWSLRFMYFEGNPLKCDCSLLPFVHKLSETDSIETDINLCLKSDLLNTMQKGTNCPDICSCGCTKRQEISFIFVDCSSRNLTEFPKIFTSNFIDEDTAAVTPRNWQQFLINQNIYPSIHIVDHALGINLENCSLESLEEVELPPNLIQLFLANNKLKFLPDSILEGQQNLKDVSLSQNPWKCDCNALKFKKWLFSKSSIVQDINDTRCGIGSKGEEKLNGRVIWTLNDDELCPGINITLLGSMVIGVLAFAIVSFLVKFVYDKYKLRINVYFYSHGFTFLKEKDTDYEKEFDAFISFSNKDDEFAIKVIISGIEERVPNLRLCTHYRHFRPGEFIYDNIILAVQNSKKTVLIITKNFIESEWCLLEFRTAHLQAMQDRVHRVIMIKYGDLPDEMDPVVKAYLRSVTYLEWGEKNFWKKLLYVLPDAYSDNDHVLRNMVNTVNI